MKRQLSYFLISVMILTVCTASGCASKTKKRYSAEFLELFDTMTIILGYTNDKDEFSDIAQTVYDRLQEYHNLYDIYNTYDGINNIKTINDNAGVKPVVVDSKIIDLLLFSKEVYEISDGKCNVAMGAVLSIWHDYREAGLSDMQNAELPPQSLLQDAAQHTDIDNVIIDTEASTVYLADPQMSLDVGAVAKGYATEKVALSLISDGQDNLLLSVGGNVRAIGGKIEGGNEKILPWVVGIKNPFEQTGDDLVNLSVLGKSLVTSGNYERFYIVDEKNYHHIIDPETLMPAEYFVSVSILCTDSGMADALSTVLFNLPLDKGKALINSITDTEAMWVLHDGGTEYSENFKEQIAP